LNYKKEKRMISGSPALQKTLEEYAKARSEAVKQARTVYAEVSRLKQYLADFGPHLMPHGLNPRDSEERAIKDIDRSFWRRAFDLTNFASIMDSEEKSKFERSLEHEPPEFNIDNIKSTFIALYQDADSMFRRGIVNVFKQLSSNYKRHDAFKISPKVIIQYSTDSFFSYPRVNYGKEQLFNDIDRCFKVLDGQKHNSRELETRLNGHWKDVSPVYEDEYYEIKAFKNGNTHWKFKRLDLLEKVNELIADHYASNVLGGGNKF
jgi:hypothetical protein